jgi:hypothetical protein
MNKRRTLYLAFVCAGFLVVGLFYTLSNDLVTEANCRRVVAGMTQAEVDAILGRPDKPRIAVVRGRLHPYPTADYGRSWSGRSGQILVIFDADGKALGSHFLSESRWEIGLRAAWWRVRRTFGL